jgi:hypothetical protein
MNDKLSRLVKDLTESVYVMELALHQQRLLLNIARSKLANETAEKRKATALPPVKIEDLLRVLKVGDIVKVSGARSAPIRRIVRLDRKDVRQHATFSGSATRSINGVATSDASDVRTCGLSKITHVASHWRPDGPSWVKIRDVIDWASSST